MDEVPKGKFDEINRRGVIVVELLIAYVVCENEACKVRSDEDDGTRRKRRSIEII